MSSALLIWGRSTVNLTVRSRARARFLGAHFIVFLCSHRSGQRNFLPEWHVSVFVFFVLLVAQISHSSILIWTNAILAPEHA